MSDRWKIVAERVRHPRRHRFYMAHRMAYFPRRWPMILGAALIVVPAVLLLNNPWLKIGASFVVSLCIGTGRMWLWRRRNPVITREQYLNHLRRNAHWN